MSAVLFRLRESVRTPPAPRLVMTVGHTVRVCNWHLCGWQAARLHLVTVIVDRNVCGAWMVTTPKRFVSLAQEPPVHSANGHEFKQLSVNWRYRVFEAVAAPSNQVFGFNQELLGTKAIATAWRSRRRPPPPSTLSRRSNLLVLQSGADVDLPWLIQIPRR